jgi:tRNA A-37 threonylcarbamoyl transferase component Bud32
LASGVPERLAGRYRVLGAVGRGAIAEVVRAQDETTGAQVALKILYPHLRESAAVVERFRREVEIVRKIAHPHVLGIHDVVDSDGVLFLVMDYHPGGDLADRLAARRAFAAHEIRDLAAQLCGALAAAHRAGVVHRDVKPSNVLCGPGPGLDARLCDFGLARTAELSGLTTANAVLGTPEYMAPEVIVDGHADPRSDIYSLGIMLFEAATGRLPFYGDSPYQLMRQHVDVEAPRAGTIAADLPPAIDAAIARALAKDPLDRFATVEDLARAIAEDAAAMIPVAPAAAAPARRACPKCAGWLVEAAAVCADCGAALLRLEYERRGVSVVVTGPGRNADKIDAVKQVALYKILDELPAGSVTVPLRGRAAPRVPFYVARGITRGSAASLIARLISIGLHACVAEDELRVVQKAMRDKLWQLTHRPMAGFGIVATQGMNITPSGWPFWARMLPFALIATGSGATLVAALRTCRRTIIAPPREAKGSTKAVQRLSQLLARLANRQDRRLVAHVIERLGQIQSLGHADAAQGLAERAAELAAALAAFDERRSAAASVSVEPARALEELRSEEVMRVVVRAELLRASSWLDRFFLGLARANASDAATVADDLRREVDALTEQLDAAAEVAAMLGKAS